ncbi:MAG: flippase [Candidatus Poribacteria bacterium]|nr:flippase [Candidatus Poribacteria bacterium]MDE0506432.1 flippase [Candidatus Poribacteria bacterium]
MNRVFENTSALLAAHLVTRLFSLGVTFLLMTRYFGEKEMGVYFLAISFTNLIATVIELGMHTPLIREMTLRLNEARHFVGNALIIRILLSIAAYGLMVGVGRLLGYPAATMQIIKLLGLAEILNLIALSYRCVFRAFEQMKYEAYTVIAERTVVCVVGGALIVLGGSLQEFCLVILIAGCMNLALSVAFARWKFVGLRFRFDLHIWAVLMRQALPFALGNMLHLVYFRIGAIMLEKLSPDGIVANAWYGLAHTIVNAVTILPGAFLGAMFPLMSRAFENDRSEFRAAYTYATRWMVLLGLPTAVGIAALAWEIVSILPADKYDPESVAPALQLLSWSCGLAFLTTTSITVLRAADKRVQFTLLMGMTTFVNVALNYLLIPRYSHVGAATSLIVSEGFLFLAGFVYISRRIATLTGMRYAIKAVVLSATMGCGLIVLRKLAPIWVLIPLSVMYYAAGMVFLGELKRDTFKQIL